MLKILNRLRNLPISVKLGLTVVTIMCSFSLAEMRSLAYGHLVYVLFYDGIPTLLGIGYIARVLLEVVVDGSD